MGNTQSQNLPLCTSCNNAFLPRTYRFECRICVRKYHPKSYRGMTVTAHKQLNGRWQCHNCITEQPSAAAGPSNAGGPSSGERDEPAKRTLQIENASPSEI